MGPREQEGVPFATVQEEEQRLIESQRKGARPEGPVGLALSGGGIRSATFNLGVLQGLAELGLLKKFDYLSTVSGGGYIGSWLSALIHRQGSGDVAQAESQITPKTGPTHSNPPPEEPAVTFLRNYSNYLTPRASIFSNDTLTAVTTYLRNLYLNLAIVVLALSSVLLVPRLVQTLGKLLQETDETLFVSAGLLLIGVGGIGYNLGFIRRRDKPADHGLWWTHTLAIVAIIVVPVVGAAWIDGLYILKYADVLKPHLVWLMFGTGVFYLLLWIVGYLFSLYSESRDGRPGAVVTLLKSVFDPAQIKQKAQMAGFTFLAGAVGGALFWLLADVVVKYLDEITKPWLGVVLGAPLLVAAYSLVVVVHIGLMGRLFSEDQREWWSRLGALLLGAMLIWLGLFGVAVIGPPLLIWTNGYVMALVSSGWLISTIGGVLAAKSGDTGGENPKPWLDLVARYAPYVFVAGTLLGLSLANQAAFSAGDVGAAGHDFYPILRRQLQVMNEVDPGLLLRSAGWLVVIALFLAWRVNINLFSLHHFYRYRLTRAYLGATNPQRHAHAFTGFDKDDDLTLSTLTQRPYPIINTAINFVGGGELAWQDRKATSFVFTPRYCGYQIPDSKDPKVVHCYYRPTPEYARADGLEISLGTAMAVSGAAVSPNQGYHTSPATAFLLTVFNVRLGRWCGNPGNPKTWRMADPRFGLRYLISELFGFSDLTSPFVYLSDGGHFENTAIYELVRRKCRLIVVGDAGADPDVTFEDIGNAVRKCRSDFGVEIRIDLNPLRPVGAIRRSAQHYAVGTIDYGSYAPGLAGKLVVLKPTLSIQRDEPADILNYADSHADFPQQPTTDQWFDEAQFESYRKLGYYTVAKGKAGEAIRTLVP